MFIRLHAIEMVDWEVIGIGGKESSGTDINDLNYERIVPGADPSRSRETTPINWHTLGFHGIINKFYRPTEHGVVEYRRLDLVRGIFKRPYISSLTSLRPRPGPNGEVYELPYMIPNPRTEPSTTFLDNPSTSG